MPRVENFIIGEEVSCRFPDGDIEVHLGVYGMTEALHSELQPLRGNVFGDSLPACARVFFTLNHLLHFYRGQAPLASYLRLTLEVPALEARNGAMLPEHNTLIEQFARAVSPGWGLVGGSDAHTLRRIGRTWTEVPGATTPEEFMTGLREGRGRPGGEHGSAGYSPRDLRRRRALHGEPRWIWTVRATVSPSPRVPRVQRSVDTISIHPACDRHTRQGARTARRGATAPRARIGIYVRR